MSADHRYEVEILRSEKAFRIPREVTSQLKGVLSRKAISNMKKEYVVCPVLGRNVPFLKCYICSNFVRRVMGVVHCRGNPLE